MLNNMLTSIGTLTFGQSLVLSGIGMSVVLLELAILAVMIVILSKVLGAVVGEKKAPAAAAAVPTPAPAAPAPVPAAPAAPARPAGLRLENVDEPSAATIMAIISDKTGIPLNHLDFHSIKGAPVELKGVDEETAAVLMSIVSKESGIPMNRLSFNSIKKVD